MKLNYIIFIAILALTGGYYFYSSTPQTQKLDQSSTEVTAKEEIAASDEKEVDYDDMTPKQQAEFSKDNGAEDVKAAEAEYTIEKAPDNSDGYEVVEQFAEDSGELMAQALAD